MKSPEFQAIWDEMLIEHKALHISAVQLNNMMSGSQSHSQIFFKKSVLPHLNSTIAGLDDLKNIAEKEMQQMGKAFDIYSKKTSPSLRELQSLLNEIRSSQSWRTWQGICRSRGRGR